MHSKYILSQSCNNTDKTDVWCAKIPFLTLQV